MAEDAQRQKPALTGDIDRSRAQLGRELDGLRYEMDLPRKLRDSFSARPAIWIGAVVVGGILLVSSFRRTKTVYVAGKKGEPEKKILQAGALVGLARMLLPVARPIVMKFVAGKVSDYARRRGDRRF
ncbi:MAG: hypothetical protein M3R59_10020 [Verrucomicrobiota bacterium]|nr:hypothetical protein [Verrucomicrobiota bacterium]